MGNRHFALDVTLKRSAGEMDLEEDDE